MSPEGGLAGYAAVNARVRVMSGRLLGASDLARLDAAPDWNSFLAILRETAYGRYLPEGEIPVEEHAQMERGLRARLSDDYRTLIRLVPTYARSLLDRMFRHFEIGNIKAILRGITAGARWEQVEAVLFPMGEAAILPAQAMLETGSVEAAVELLAQTPYYGLLSHALERYAAERRLFALEVSLDLGYWRGLWGEVSRLPSQDRAQTLRILGALVDMNNILWAARYRVFRGLSEEEIINYTLPFGHRVKDEDIRAIAVGGDISQVVGRVLPGFTDPESRLADLRTGLPYLEQTLERYVAQCCRNALMGNPFHLGVPLAYLVLAEFELQDLTVRIEARAEGKTAAEYRSYLLAEETPA